MGCDLKWQRRFFDEINGCKPTRCVASSPLLLRFVALTCPFLRSVALQPSILSFSICFLSLSVIFNFPRTKGHRFIFSLYLTRLLNRIIEMLVSINNIYVSLCSLVLSVFEEISLSMIALYAAERRKPKPSLD